ncbi:hypothetical protein Syun_016831 [Stephania yunnanensis]|uniref:Uncharacterized protein n=1 Tax=Stephania yunnanensis TaxID=152371 RepID=A0AAP0P2T3_9MAGN
MELHLEHTKKEEKSLELIAINSSLQSCLIRALLRLRPIDLSQFRTFKKTDIK